ncbi:uncharacterized protein LOC123713700 isoform X2 [Pieris brassicae]|uniref:uncharacterized protein LOC123713700 isoform X2 n=1 Tax=Pieris brassicae TaxID=7116 RepID=UPI001E65EF14|nr:uncharacterized protein LOC123713700 isoform X2 [Pieris brassicae]
MSSKFIIFLFTTILFLGQILKTKGDSHSAGYEDPEDHNNYNKGQRKTIHSLRGHYKEEIHRLLKCGSIDKKEKHIHVSDKSPQTEVNVATTRIENSSTNEILTTTENLREGPRTTANAVETEESKTDKKSINETKETTITPDNFVTRLLPVSEKLGVINDTSVNDITTPHLNTEYLTDTTLHLRRALDEEDPINNIDSETSSHSSEQNNHDTILDSTQKNFVFESLVIKNEPDGEISNRKHQFLDQSKDANFNNEETNDIRMPSNLNEEKFPINYYNPFTGPPPMKYALPIYPNVLKVQEMDKSNLMLIEHPRVCFACSSTNNPTCWLPDMSTPAKYCRGGHNACVTKTYKHRGYAFVVRDCAASCVNRDLPDNGLYYRSCTICHSDLCNGANFTSFSLKTIILLLITIWFKYT